MFDTHCHLNFKAFDDIVDEIISHAKAADVTHITIPGTDIDSSKKAIAIAEKNDGIYAAVGIHPHHVFEHVEQKINNIKQEIMELEEILEKDSTLYILHSTSPIVAIGEIGLDRHIYQKTKYGEYNVNDEFMSLQKEFFVAQLELAKKFKKSVIIHNREAKDDLLPLLHEHWDSFFEGRMVIHCCEPEVELLKFVIDHKIFLGVDGDVTWDMPTFAKASAGKQEFITKVPLENLVLETDSPFLLPEPLKSQKKYPNVPANLKIIAEFVAKLRGESCDMLTAQTTENATKLFNIRH